MTDTLKKIKPLIDKPWGKLWQADCRGVLPIIATDSLDAMCSDPPAGIEFMGKDWDNPDKYGAAFAAHGFTDGGDRVPAPAQKLSERNPNCRTCHKHARGADGCRCEVPDLDEPPELIQERRLQQRKGFIDFLESVMREAFRVLKPGAHGVVWALPRTSHWTATALENVGFEIRDCIYHVKPRSPEVTMFLASLSPEQWELLERCSPTDEFLLHIFGSGFPKSLDISKALDKMAGAVREVIGHRKLNERDQRNYAPNTPMGYHWTDVIGDKSTEITSPTTDEAKLWAGWGTALKPAVEVWWICRKPIREVNVATQVRKTRTGAINIDGSRVAGVAEKPGGKIRAYRRTEATTSVGLRENEQNTEMVEPPDPHPGGRWPSHLLLSHAPDCQRIGTKNVAAVSIHGKGIAIRRSGVHSEAGGHQTVGTVQPVHGYANEDGTETVESWGCSPECPVRMLNEQSGDTQSSIRIGGEGEPLDPSQEGWRFRRASGGFGDAGGASRFFKTFEYDPPFFYAAKASRSERDAGLKGDAKAMHALKDSKISTQSNRRCVLCQRVKFGQPHCECLEPEWEETSGSLVKNNHPTVKSLKLMRYLVRLVTPKGGTVLDPFAGSGSTLVAALQEGAKFVGIEREEEYALTAKERVLFVAEEELGRQQDAEVFDLLSQLDQEGF